MSLCRYRHARALAVFNGTDCGQKSLCLMVTNGLPKALQ